MNVGIGNEAAKFHFWEYINQIFGTGHIAVTQQGVEIRTRSKHAAARSANHLATSHFSLATQHPNFAMPHSTQLRHTQFSYTTSQLATPHPNLAMRHVPLSYATPQFSYSTSHLGTLHPT